MRIAFVTAGAAGMYCGSCMRDNTLVAALVRSGHDATLVPTFTPIRTDDEDVSTRHVFYGGVNVYLQDKSRLFRSAPRFVDWVLNRPALLRFVSRFASSANYSKLGGLTLSMLRGEHGHQRKELTKLIAWLRDELRPEVVVLTNALLSAIAPAARQELGVPVLVTLQGDDIFLDALPADDRAECILQIRENDQSVAGYVSTSGFYADTMSQYLGVDRAKIDVIYPGLNLHGHGPTDREPDRLPTIGYFARIAPEKGFHNLVDAFIHLRKSMGISNVRLRFAGWIGNEHRPYLNEQLRKLTDAGLAGDAEHLDCPGHVEKVRFLNSVDVLSVPTTYHEPKGLYVLESWANAVPVVQPRHGSFPELIEATGAGLLCEPGNPTDLAAKLAELLADPDRRRYLGRLGRQAVEQRFHADVMAAETVAVLNKYVSPAVSARVP